MDTVKTTVYNALSSLTGVTVQKANTAIGQNLPVLAYRVSQNAPRYDFDKTIGLQDVEITIDIFAAGSTSTILASAEAKMREIDYFLTYTADLLDPEGLEHTNARFTANI